MAFPNVCNYAGFGCISISVRDLSLELTLRAHVLASGLPHTWAPGLKSSGRGISGLHLPYPISQLLGQCYLG